jgi:hypothetical protein
MKTLFYSLLLSLSLITGAYAGDEPKETTKVCVDVTKNGQPVKDKSGKVQQQCKTMKVHKKLEGTKVPEKK